MAPQTDPRRADRRPAPRLPAGSALLGLATLVAAGTLGLALPTANAVFCDRLAPLAVLAALAATLIALCFRSLAAARVRPAAVLFALLLASVAFFASARFLARYHGACSEVQRRLQQLKGEH